jgi:transposase-like protein
MSEFKWRHFQGEIILWAVRWYCRYGIRYRDLEQRIGRARRAGRSFHDLSLGSKVRA